MTPSKNLKKSTLEILNIQAKRLMGQGFKILPIKPPRRSEAKSGKTPMTSHGVSSADHHFSMMTGSTAASRRLSLMAGSLVPAVIGKTRKFAAPYLTAACPLAFMSSVPLNVKRASVEVAQKGMSSSIGAESPLSSSVGADSFRGGSFNGSS
jgi:hypothetical protein